MVQFNIQLELKEAPVHVDYVEKEKMVALLLCKKVHANMFLK